MSAPPTDQDAYDRRPMMVALAVVIALLVVGAVDYSRTSDKLPEAPGQCRLSDDACQRAANAAFSERVKRSYELNDDLEARAWAYAAAALLTLLGGLAVTLRRTAPSRRREPFTDIGVGSVAWLLATLVVAVSRSGPLIEAPTGPMFALGGVALALAAIGTLATRSVREPREEASGWRARLEAAERYVAWAGAALTAITVILAIRVISGFDDPCGGREPDWVDPTLSAGGIAALGAAACGIALLFRRRWIVALTLLVLGPLAIFWAD